MKPFIYTVLKSLNFNPNFLSCLNEKEIEEVKNNIDELVLSFENMRKLNDDFDKYSISESKEIMKSYDEKITFYNTANAEPIVTIKNVLILKGFANIIANETA